MAQFKSITDKGKSDLSWINENEETGKAYLAQIRMNMSVMKRLGQYEEAAKELLFF